MTININKYKIQLISKEKKSKGKAETFQEM